MLNQPRATCLYSLDAKTFRARSKAIFSKWPTEFGRNLQNVEKYARRMYWADEGKILLQPDQAGAEALITAYYCKAGKFRELFTYGVKPHVFVALHNFLDIWKFKFQDLDLTVFAAAPIPLLKKLDGWKKLDSMIKESDDWAPEERYYYIAKQMCHSANYGIKEGAFRLNTLVKSGGKIVLSNQQASKYLSNYHNLFPEIRDWHRRMDKQMEEEHVLYNMFGYPLNITCDVSESNKKEFYAWGPQSTVGVITHKAITSMQSYIEKEKLSHEWDLLQNNHDSYLMQVPDDVEHVKHAALKMTEFLEQDLVSPFGDKFKMRSEMNVGYNWAPHDEHKNPFGLKKYVTK